MQMLEIKGKISFADRIAAFLGSYPLKINFPNQNYALIGRGSVSILKRIVFHGGVKHDYPLLECGNYCEASECQILVDGEHSNDKIVNITLSSFPLLRNILKKNNNDTYKCHAKSTIKIGNNVTLSSHAIILSGAVIGNGAVIGANAIVASTIPEYEIAVGIPARGGRKRVSKQQIDIANELRWWDFEPSFLTLHIDKLFDLESNYDFFKTNAIYADDTKKVVIDFIPQADKELQIRVSGVEIDGKFTTLDESPEFIKNYFRQMSLPESQTLTWVPNIFLYL